ncbi:MAG: SGNH/GDSL hydrolase family protein [Flavobacteriales bacterium]|nr:SGNH/GDSL hydrolase family protein [Flavobacteriales bacterium]
MGDKPGVLKNELFPVERFIPQTLFRSDDYGISSYVDDSPRVPKNYILNQQGFRSSFDYDSLTIDSLREFDDRKVIFLIGDSYTEGCCDLPVDSSFADLLTRHSSHHILNFGIGGTDLTQYLQIVKKYVPKLKPDLVIIAFYLGNDIAYAKREPAPRIPIAYAIQKYPWMNSSIPPFLKKNYPKEQLESEIEAYQFYLNQYSLWGHNTNWIHRIIRRSVLLSKLYLGTRLWYYRIRWAISSAETDPILVTTKIIKGIQQECNVNGVKLLVLGIPSPSDAIDQTDLSSTYSPYFKSVEHRFPLISSFSESDYDGPKPYNHFLNSGHLKFYNFINLELHSEIEKHKSTIFTQPKKSMQE